MADSLGGIPKHHALVAGTLLLRAGPVHPLIDVWRLLMYGRQNSAGFTVKHVVTFGVSDSVDDIRAIF
ncbi:hypothetical protein [Echinicola jeungdonensis]|uniref:hypothetical protein n=1 Tax=Echinicola jeungdonensis TaxID=709343 RepID=UPI003F494D6B